MAEYEPKYAADPDGLREGLPVYARGGAHLGEVKTLADGCFKVDRELQPDLWLANGAVADVRDGRVILVPLTEELDEFTVVPP